jgi:hypothetical protein
MHFERIGSACPASCRELERIDHAQKRLVLRSSKIIYHLDTEVTAFLISIE